MTLQEKLKPLGIDFNSMTYLEKLSFLLQEMNREVNTIASKANDAGISQLVVRIKDEQEKMREQVENME